MDVKCAECNHDLYNKSKFGFSECFSVHKFCYLCIEKITISDLRCPKDQISSPCLTKLINNILVDVDKYFFDVIREIRIRNPRCADSLINELETACDSVLSISRCGRCLNDQVFELTCGLSECFPRHRFCFNCVAEMAKKELRCPIDKKCSQLAVITINGVHNFRDRLYFQAIRYLEIKGNERCNELIEEIQINGQIGLSICCSCFKDFENESIFGFSQCFFKHGFCFCCILKTCKQVLRCPVEGNTCELLQMSVGNVVTEVQKDHLMIMFQINQRERSPLPIEESQLKCHIDINKCSICKKVLSTEITFGLKECFAVHFFCLKCIEKVVLQGYLCPIDKAVSSGIRIITEKSFLDVDKYHFEMIKCFKKNSNISARQLIDNLKICSNLGLKLICCKACSREIRNQAMFGYSECFHQHGFCIDCIDKRPKDIFRCSSCVLESRSIQIMSNNSILDVDKYHFVVITYLQLLGSEKAKKLSESMMFMKPYPVNVCIICLSENLTDKFMIGYEKCMSYHRMCVPCAAKVHCLTKQWCAMDHDERVVTPMYAVQTVHEVAARSMEPTKIDGTFLMTYRYLLKMSSNHNAALCAKLQRHMIDTTEWPSNVCIDCLGNIFSASYGFSLCHQSHVFCENCATSLTIGASKCPVDGQEVGAIYKYLQSGGPTGVLDRHYFRIMQHLRGMSFDKTRAKILRDTLHEQKTFPDTVCLTCLEDARPTDRIRYRCKYGHRLCYQCSTKIDLSTVQCTIDKESFMKVQ